MRQLPLVEGRAVGGPIARGVFAAYTALALAGLTAASVALVLAAPALARHEPLASLPVLATHLLALTFLPAAVTAASFHLLPVLLRNDVGHPVLLRVAAVLLLGGFFVGPGIAYDVAPLLWVGATAVAAALACVLAALMGLVVGAPRNRTLVASRAAISLVALHVTAALALGAVVFSHGDATFAGVPHDRWLLVHLHLAVVGWLTLLIVAVGRTLGPMLAHAPSQPARRVPVLELVLSGGLWLLLAGLALASRPLAIAGGAVALLALAAFARVLVRVARERRLPLEAPLVHLLAGVAFLLQAAVLGFAMLAGAVGVDRGVASYVVLLLLGWAAGITLGHLGKLLSLSLWVWWPPGPRPKQDDLYPRSLWLLEAAVFAAAVELVAVGAFVASTPAVRVGGALLVVAAALACTGALHTWRRRSRPVR